MKVCTYQAMDSFLIEDRDVPGITDDEMLVKTKMVGICGTDIHKAMHRTVKPGTILGHEISGVVHDAGKNVHGFKAGDRVAIAHHAPCMSCKACVKGHHSLCDQYLKTNVFPGGFSEYIRLPRENVKHTVKHVGDGVSFDEAAFMEPLACCLRGFDRLDHAPGDSYLVMGLGPIGMLFCQIAKAFNAGSISGVDIDGYRLKFAHEQLGIQHLHDPSGTIKDGFVTAGNPEGTYDHVIVSVGNGKVYQGAMKNVTKGTNVLFFAECPDGQDIVIDPNLVYRNELKIVGSYSSSPAYLTMAIDMISSGAIDVKKLITHVFPYEKIGDAMALAARAQQSLKVMVSFG